MLGVMGAFLKTMNLEPGMGPAFAGHDLVPGDVFYVCSDEPLPLFALPSPRL